MASIRKLPSGRYRIRWRDHDGNEYGRTVPTKKLADQIRAEVEVELARGGSPDPRRARRTMASYLEEYLETRTDLRESTRALYETQARRHVIPGIGHMALGAIDAADLRRFYAKLAKAGVGVPTIEVIHRLISRTLNQALDDGLISANPAARARAPHADRKPVRVLSRVEIAQAVFALDAMAVRAPADEIKRGLESLANSSSEGRRLERLRGEEIPASVAGSMTLLAAFSGLRFGEVAAMRQRHLRLLDPQGPRVQVVEAVSEVRGRVEIGATKTKGSRRTITILGTVRDTLLARGAAEGAPDDLAFPTPTGLPMSRTRFRARQWIPAVRLAQVLPEPGFHDLRHSYAAWLMASRFNLKDIQERLGHTSIRTTIDVYGHLQPGREAEQDAQLELALWAEA